MRRSRPVHGDHSPARRARAFAVIALAAIGCVPDSWTLATISDEPRDAADVVASDATDAADVVARDATDSGDLTDVNHGDDADAPRCDDACMSGCARGLVALYRGDGDARDAIGAHHGAASPSVTYVDGRFGRAFDMGGSPDFVTLPAAVGDFAGDFTIALWFRSASGGELITRRPSCAAPHTFAGFDTGVTDTGIFASEVFPVGGYFVLRASVRSDLGAWHHGALVRRGAVFEQWLDGVRGDTQASLGGFVDPTASPLYLGVGRCVVGAPGSNGTADTRQWYRGALDDVAFYDRALSPAELMAWADGSCAP